MSVKHSLSSRVLAGVAFDTRCGVRVYDPEKIAPTRDHVTCKRCLAVLRAPLKPAPALLMRRFVL